MLLALVLLGGALALVVGAPERSDRAQRVRGHRVFRVSRPAVHGLEVTLGERQLTARRAGSGWTVDGRPAGPGTAAALDEVLARLAALRAVDVFRPREEGDFGFTRPRAIIVLLTERRARRVVLGEPTVAGNALYARREGDRRVMQVGIAILSDLERLFYNHARERHAGA